MNRSNSASILRKAQRICIMSYENTTIACNRLNLAPATTFIIDQHVKNYGRHGSVRLVESSNGIISLVYLTDKKCDYTQLPVTEGAIVFISKEVNEESVITIFISKEMKKQAEEKFEKEEAAKTSTQQAAAAPQQPASAPAADNALALKIGKAVLYTAGAGAAIAAGVWAWKKWGNPSSM